jgi:hypothetical protein
VAVNWTIRLRCATGHTEEFDMWKTMLLALAFAGLAAPSQADSLHLLNGIFCNAEENMNVSLSLMQQGVSPRLASELANQGAVNCVFADKIRYVITRPIRLGEAANGYDLIRYEGTAIGVAVGKNIRPFEPPVRVYFLTLERLEDAVTVGGA